MFKPKSFFQSTPYWHSGWVCVLEVTEHKTDPDFGRFDFTRSGEHGFALSPRWMRFAGVFRPWLFAWPKPTEGGALISYRMTPALLDTFLWGGVIWFLVFALLNSELGPWPALAWSVIGVWGVWALLFGVAYMICGGPRRTLAFVHRALPEGKALLDARHRSSAEDDEEENAGKYEEE